MLSVRALRRLPWCVDLLLLICGVKCMFDMMFADLLFLRRGDPGQWRSYGLTIFIHSFKACAQGFAHLEPIHNDWERVCSCSDGSAMHKAVD